MLEQLIRALVELEEDQVLEMVRSELAGGTEPLSILQACQQGMTEVGDRFENKEYFVSDLMMSGEIFKQVGELLEPGLESVTQVSAGAVVIGTVQGDIHDIGKDIVVNMLKSANLDVTDLGVDVPPARFVDAAQRGKHLSGHFFAQIYVFFELADSRTLQGFDLFFGNFIALNFPHPGDGEATLVIDAGDQGAVATLNEHLDGAIGQF